MQPFLADFPVTLSFVALCGIALTPLTSMIGLYRAKIGVLRGDGGDQVLFKRIRMHGNFIETAPIVALSLAGAEALGLAAVWLWLGFISFWAGRVLHYFLYDMKARGFSMTLTTLPPLCWGTFVLWRLWLAG